MGWKNAQSAALLAVVIAAVPLAGCGSEAPPKAEAESVAVTLHRVGAQQAGALTRATGTVRLRRETPLAFLSDGRVQTVAVRAGDQVGAGQLLATLDPVAIDAAATAADVRARQAAAELKRQQELYRRGWVAKARVESAEASAEAARADRSAAQFQQRFARITAPTGGIILARQAEPGQAVAAGTPVLVLGEFSSGFVLRVPMSAADAGGLSAGQTAVVRFRDQAAPEMAGRVIEVAGRADPGTATFQVEFALPANPALRSGLIADVELPRGQAAGTTLIPATALFAARADEGFVWLYDPPTRTVRARMVKLGRVSGDGIELVSGLARGDRIVAAGVNRLVEGQKVTLVAGAAD